jgi:hypothetical protein
MLAHMVTTHPLLKHLSTLFWGYIWPDRTRPLGRLLWQGNVNGAMITSFIFLSPTPLVCLLVLLALVGISVWVHGRWAATFAAVCGVSGWAVEAFLQYAGPMWRFSVVEPFNPTGVPFYMLAGWALVGLFSVALADVVRPTQPSTPPI